MCSPIQMMDSPNLKGRYVAAMVLSGAGDAIGFRNGSWEFCYRGRAIFDELQSLGGLEDIKVKLPGWMVSDDTVMHLATAEALVEASKESNIENIFLTIARYYKECMKDMNGRAPGRTCISGANMLKPGVRNGYKIPFNAKGGGCGGAMRSMCIGLRYPRPEQLDQLIAVSIEAGRMTHHHPIGFLGSLASALFTSYAVQGRPVLSWGHGLMEALPKALACVRSSGHCVLENEQAWGHFEKAWTDYLKLRQITDGQSEPIFPEKFDFEERDKFVKSVSVGGWGGSMGHDAPMIAYDALLGAGSSWHELCYRAMLHGGDSDSTGVIAACWFGTLYGCQGVPEGNYESLEYNERLKAAGAGLFELAFPDPSFVDAHDKNVG
ncbi:protein ADP-ribosylarginine hydrolase isoform X2 [Aplysia californica]|uniref:ADP-ribosylhydrolase ARH1 n=1 Tax=Aplysia californica TaxID=6500 RepID=A0ABM1W379_APLCA|nr:protein ADP-ribosylarginine hydrolase isoform X2 [Aplysia californica]